MTDESSLNARTVAAGEPLILVVDDEVPFARAVARRLRRDGYECRLADSLSAAREELDRRTPDMVLLDMRLPDGNGLELLNELRQRQGSDLPVLVMTAYGELDDAVEAMKLQALDYLKKPVDLDELAINIERTRLRGADRHSLDSARSREAARMEGPSWVGASAQCRQLLEQVQRMGQIAATAEAPPTVLLCGETGTGKDLLARLLHQSRGDATLPFVQVDCAALPPQLIESELFGHEKGAFTSATQARLGLFEAAENGTLFLDEIGELSLELQAKLLAVMERRSLRRVGSNRECPVSAWIIAATNRDLARLVEAGGFRRDLFYRLQVFDLTVPPLRDRREDIPALVEHFIALTARRYGVARPQLPERTRQALLDYDWPGNVRELKHWIERAVLLNRSGQLGEDGLGQPVGAAGGLPDLSGMTLEQAERILIEQALERHRGNVSRAARTLGVTRMALRYRMDKHGIQRPAEA